MKLEGGLKLVGGDIEGFRPEEVTELPDPSSVASNRLMVREGALRFAKNGSEWASVRAPDTGPGPAELIAGDSNAGYFGLVSAADLITGDDLDAAIGMTYGNDPGNSDIGWIKFQHSGKVLFVARGPLHGSISWNEIDSIGAAYGQATVTVGGYSYKVRLLRGGNGDPSSGPGGEWDDLLYPITNGTWADLSYGDIGKYGNHAGTWCMEAPLSNSSYRIQRGGQRDLSYYATQSSSHGSYSLWRPVLELIQ